MGHSVLVFENKVLRGIFRRQRDKIMEGYIIREIKLRKMKWGTAWHKWG
jgi:hypothetical protein